MGALRLLPGERQEASLRPHPLGFLGAYAAACLPALWGAGLWILFRSAWWTGAEAGRWYQVWTHLYGNAVTASAYALAGMALLGVLVAVLAVRWSLFFGFLAAGAGAVAASVALPGPADAWLPAIMAAWSVPALLWVEVLRRSHRYHLTNLRIVFRGGVLVHHERQVRYEAITDLDGVQGPLGRLLDCGSVVPVTQSGFGLGEDASHAGLGAAGGVKRAGLGAGVGAAAGGSRSLNVARARTFHRLTGIRPYGETKLLLERLIQEATSTPYLKEQVGLQRRIVAALEGQGA